MLINDFILCMKLCCTVHTLWARSLCVWVRPIRTAISFSLFRKHGYWWITSSCNFFTAASPLCCSTAWADGARASWGVQNIVNHERRNCRGLSSVATTSWFFCRLSAAADRFCWSHYCTHKALMQVAILSEIRRVAVKLKAILSPRI